MSFRRPTVSTSRWVLWRGFFRYFVSWNGIYRNTCIEQRKAYSSLQEMLRNDGHLSQKVSAGSQCSGEMESHRENKFLSIFLQTNFRCLLLWFAFNFVLFSIHCLLHHLIFHTFCKGWHVTEQSQHRGVIILCVGASTAFWILTITFTVQVHPMNPSYSVWWSQ